MGGVSSTFDKVPGCYGGGGGNGLDQCSDTNHPSSTIETVDRSHLMNHPLHRSHTAAGHNHGHLPCPATSASSSHRSRREIGAGPGGPQADHPACHHRSASSGVGCGGAVSVGALQQLPGRGISKLQTLRKKMSKLRRRSNVIDYGKQLRELVSGWNYRQLHSLRQEYEALSVLKELTFQAIVARPTPSTVKTDLGRLFESGWCSDTRISYRGVIFDVHRSILSARCPFFRSRFNSWLARPDVTNNSSLPRGGSGGRGPPPSFYTTCSGSSYSLPRDLSPSSVIMPVEMDDGGSDIDVHMFTCLLKYLYTGSMCLEEARLENWETLAVLCERFGMPNPLDHDLKRLVESGVVGTGDTDCVLVFTHTSPQHHPTAAPQCGHHHHYHCCQAYSPYHPLLQYQQPPCELHCHRAILASRSKFFRSVILRREVRPGDAGDPLGGGSHLAPVSNSIRLVLDEWIIPRRLARVLIYCLYTDQLDLSLVSQSDGSCWMDREECPYTAGGSPASHSFYLHRYDSDVLPTSSMSTPKPGESSTGGTPPPPRETAAAVHTHAGPPPLGMEGGVVGCHACLQDLMELYQIGQFIDFPILCHNCEDLLVKSLCVDTIVDILRWSSQQHGSAYVHRQASHYLREDFLTVAHSPTLYQLSKEELAGALTSNFLQARESDLLGAVVRWGEHQLVRQMEDRDPLHHAFQPNHHNHHIAASKKVIKRKDLSDTELVGLIGDLIPLVRLEHVLPACSDQVHSAIRRGLIPNPPPLYMLATPPPQPEDRVASWCRSPPVKPRLQMGGVALAPRSSLLESPATLHRASSLLTSCTTNSSDSSSAETAAGHGNGSFSFHTFQPPRLFTPFYDEIRFKVCKSWLDPPGMFSPRAPLRQPLDLLPSPWPAQTLPPLDAQLVKSVRKRARHLDQLLIVQRALLLACVDRAEVYRQLQLRALREAGLPDEAAPAIFVSGVMNPPGWVSPGHRCAGQRRHVQVDKQTNCTIRASGPGPHTPSSPAPSHSSFSSQEESSDLGEPSACQVSIGHQQHQLPASGPSRQSIPGRPVPRHPPDVTCGNGPGPLKRREGPSPAMGGGGDPLDLGMGLAAYPPSPRRRLLLTSSSSQVRHSSHSSDTEEYEENSLFV